MQTQVTYKVKPIRMKAYFSLETLKATGAWNDALEVLIDHNCPTKLLHPAKLFAIVEKKRKKIATDTG